MTTRQLIQPKAAPPTHAFTPVRTGLLQRKCACGGSPGLEGECEECRKNRMTLQRSAANRAESTGVPPIVHEVLHSPGQPLDPATRAFMEPRFGHDFSKVRVHTDAKSAESARAVNALAYTVGRDVVFSLGQFASGTSAGQRLLAHELTHVLQQGQGAPTLRRAGPQANEPIRTMAVGHPMLSRQDPPYPGAIAHCRSIGVPCPAPHFHHGTVCRLVTCRRVPTANLPFAISPGICIYQCLDGQICTCVLFGTATLATCVITLCDRGAQASSETDLDELSARAVAAAAEQLSQPEQEGKQQSNSEAVMQAKLEIGESGDPYEQEAELIARKVMQVPDHQKGQPVGHTSAAAPGASPSETRELLPASPTPVQHHSTGLRLSRQNAPQTTNVLNRGAVASVQLIVGGIMNSTRVGPVSQHEDVSVIIGRLTTIRSLAQQLLSLWNTATPFTPPGGAAPIAFAPLTVDELAKGLLVFNRYRLAIPPAANPPVMTNWKIGMRFPLPIRIDATTNEGVLHPDPIRSMAGTFDAAWVPLLNALPAVLPAQTGASLQQSVADFLTAQPSTLARGIHLGARAVANAQDSREFILEVFNQVGAGAFELALALMDYLVNQDIGVLAPQTAGAAILARIRMLLAAPPAGVTPARQSSLNRANLMLGIVAGVQPLPDPCIPNRKLTWANFAGAVPAGAPANREAETRFDINQVAFHGNQLFQAVFDPASWVRPRSGQPGNLAVNGCQPQINACEALFNGVPAGAVGAHWDLPAGPAPACPATILPGALRANNFGDCANLIGTACTRARQADSQTRLLPHEQLHFDIPCVLVHKANAARASGAALTLAAVRARANTLTGQYDSQTNHGCLGAPQARWESDVAAGLPAQTFP